MIDIPADGVPTDRTARESPARDRTARDRTARDRTARDSTPRESAPGDGAEPDRGARGSALADHHDALLVDLDGTLVLAGHPIPEAADALAAAAARGARPVIVTNNASRSPRDVAESLADLGFDFTADDVVSSPEVAAALLADSHPTGAPVLVVGAQALCDAVADAGLTPVRTAGDAPVAVVQGHSPDTGWRNLAEACIAIRAGADWVATNTDSTLPTDRGLLPGNGSMVAALVAATGSTPRVAGKPARPLLDAAARRVRAAKPLVVGDRLDTDIAAAVAAGMPSLCVLTGVSTAQDLIAAGPDRRPTWVSADLRGLVDPSRAAALDGSGTTPGWEARLHAGRVVVSATGAEGERSGPVFALAAVVAAAWQSATTEVDAGDDAAAAALRSWGLLGGEDPADDPADDPAGKPSPAGGPATGSRPAARTEPRG